MAPKRPSPLDEPPAASSSEEEETSSEEAGSGSEESGSDDEAPQTQTQKTQSTAKPQPKKQEPASAAKPQSSSSGETESESESESDGENAGKTSTVHVKPIASKPMEAVTPPPKATKPRSKPPASPVTAKTGTKRAAGGESELNKDSKKPKKKGEEEDEEDGVGEESKKSKLFQRIWSDDDEIIILKGMHEYATKKGVDPYADMAAFHDFIKKSLKVDVSKVQLQDKIRRLKKKFENNMKKKQKPTKPHDSKAFELSKKVWGGGDDGAAMAKQAEANGKAKAKSNSKSMASAEPSKPLKEAEKSEASLRRCAASSVMSEEVVGFDKGFMELGLSETIVQKGLELVGGSKCAELKDKWSKLHIAELELFVRRTQLMNDQGKMILEAFKADH